MAVRTALLNGNNINLDSDFSKYVESLTSQGVISGFDMTTTSVGVGKAFVKCTRTNGETIMVYVENTESIAISGNGYIVIKVPQAMIDDGTNNPADGIGIATVELVETLPSANYMTLGQIVGGVLADVRYFIPKVQNIDSLLTRMTTAEADIEQLELAGVPDHLEQSAIVGEKYALTDKMFKQAEPNVSNSTAEYKVGDTATNTQVHIQRIGSGTASNTITLKIKSVGSPTTALHCDVYAGQKYNVSGTESAWYGTGTALATSSKAYSTFSNSWKTITFTLDNSVGGTKGQLLDIVVYQEGNIVNASNYYVLACDSTSYSEAFRCIGVNGTTRTPSYLMPCCSSDGFSQYMLSKKKDTTISNTGTYSETGNSRTTSGTENTVIFDKDIFAGTFTYTFTLSINAKGWSSSSTGLGPAYMEILLDGVSLWKQQYSISSSTGTFSVSFTCSHPGHLVINAWGGQHNSSSYRWTINLSNTSVSGTFSIIGNTATYKILGVPTELLEIGLIGKLNVFGAINEVDFNNGMKDIQNCIDLFNSPTTSTTATAGSIALGNCVGYITIGTKKIPYYNL